MALSIRFPLYGSSVVTGPYNVSLSFDLGGKSEISKSIGLDEGAALLIPNISYIRKVVEGNLGIADGMFGKSMFENLSNPISSKNPEVFGAFSENTGTDSGNNTPDKTGRVKVKKDDISFELDKDVGFKMLETIAIKSIFESQKPYMEIAAIIIDLVGDIEDIIARLAPLVSVSPLTTKSKRPKVNDKDGKGPRAIGFEGGDLKEKMEELKNMDTGGDLASEGGNVNDTGGGAGDSSGMNISDGYQGSLNSDKYDIISIRYSTGQFDPVVDYKYTYIDLPPEVNDNSKTTSPPEGSDEVDSFEKYKPETLVFGIFKEDGTPLDPNEKLKYTETSNGVSSEVDTPYTTASWITRTDKWGLDENVTSWPAFSEPIYYEKNGNKQYYKKGDKNVLTDEEAIEGNPIITGFTPDDTTEYLNYYADILTYGLAQSGLPTEEQNSLKVDILKNLDVSTQLENTLLYGQLSEESIYEPDDFPELMRKVLKPMKVYSAQAEADPKLKAYAESKGERPGMVWVNPEIDYKLKVIKVEPATGTSDGVVDPANLTNDILKKNGRFSDGKYGHGSEEEPQEVDTIKRFMATDLDTETYYIIEGVLMEEDGEDKDKTDENANTNKSDSKDWYRLPHALGVFKVFIKMVMKIFTKLVPSAISLISLFGGPAKFLTDIIITKLGEFFGPLSPDSVSKLKTSLNTSPSQFDNTGDYVKARKKPIKESRLKNFVFVDNSGGLKTIIDGSALIPFVIFGKDLSFGLDLMMGDILNRPPVKLVFPSFKNKSKQKDEQKTNAPYQDTTKRDVIIPALSNGGLSSEGAFEKLDTEYPFDTRPTNLRGSESVVYSTGEYIPGVDYNYIYINEDVKGMLDKVDELVKKGDDESILEANILINKAIALDPENKYLLNKKKDLKDKLEKVGANTQPLLKLILGIVTLPVKIIAGIIEYILDFFKSLTNPFTLPAKMVEFLSFKWILDFFTPKFLLDRAGIKFDPVGIALLVAQAFVKKPDGSWLMGDDVEITNIPELLSIIFRKELPIYTFAMLRENPGMFTLMFRPILCLFEGIINGIIKFIWAVLGIEAIIPVPQIKLCDDNLSPEEQAQTLNNDNIDDLLNPEDKSKNGINGGGDTALDQYVYEIKLPNGEIVRKANLEELNKYIEENDDIGYEKNF